MRIRIVRATVCDGQPVEPGAELDVPDRLAELLVHMGKAVEAKLEPDIEVPRPRRQRAIVEAPERAVQE